MIVKGYTRNLGDPYGVSLCKEEVYGHTRETHEVTSWKTARTGCIHRVEV